MIHSLTAPLLPTKVLNARTREFGVFPFGARIDTYFTREPGYDWNREPGAALVFDRREIDPPRLTRE